MGNYIIPLQQKHLREVYRYLMSEEIWQMIPLDALLPYGLNNKNQRWFAELENGQLYGIIFQDKQLLHFSYLEPPTFSSPLYSFIYETFPSFITHGRKEILEPIKQGLGVYQCTMYKESLFVKQSVQTQKVVLNKKLDHFLISIRRAQPSDITALYTLLEEYALEQNIDFLLIKELISLGRVQVATYNRELLGSIMILKESSHYMLLGGLFVTPRARQQGIARLLGQQIILDTMKRGKQICFYYDQQELKSFYDQGAFIPVGRWCSFVWNRNS